MTKDWSRQGRTELGPGDDISGALRDGEQIEAASSQQVRRGGSRNAVRDEDATQRRRIGFAAVVFGGVMMVAGAVMVAAAVL